MAITNNYSNQLAGGYYALNQSQGAGATGAVGANTAANSSTKTSVDSAFLLSLSLEAQDYLQGIGLSGNQSTIDSSPESFTLSASQQETLDAIIEKYAGQPFTQETFDAIQDDLAQAGLSPDQLAQQEQVKAFNPTTELLRALNGENSGDSEGDQASSLLDALNGTASNNRSSSQATANYDTAKNNYIQYITDAFEKVAEPLSA